MDLAALKAELADPAGLGYTEDDAADAEALNAPVRTVYVQPTEDEVFGHCDLNGYWGRIARLTTLTEAEIAAEYFAGDLALARSAKQAGLGARDRRYTTAPGKLIDVRASAFGQMCALFVAMGVIPSQALADELLAKGTRDGSRAEELWGAGTVVTPSQIADARRLA